jgi:hypothetical protein
MPVDEQTKRRIIDLSFNEHNTIRDLEKITKKSSRDIISILRNSEHKGKEEENDTRKLNQQREITEQGYNSLLLNTKTYRLFSEGKKPIEVAITLKLSADL